MITALVSTEQLSGSELAFSVLFLLFCALSGYRMSVRFRVARGVTPWRLPSVLWALIGFLFNLFGLLIELLAQVTTRSGLPGSTIQPLSGRASGITRYDQSGPANPYRQGGTAASVVGAAPSEPEDEVRHSPPDKTEHGYVHFGWYKDVTGRHELRYWDGKGWQDLVADGGVVSRDPL